VSNVLAARGDVGGWKCRPPSRETPTSFEPKRWNDPQVGSRGVIPADRWPMTATDNMREAIAALKRILQRGQDDGDPGGGSDARR
jgi:hypothetical protein